MLYERWRQVAREHASELAVFDAATGERPTFKELAGAVERALAPAEPVLYPQGHGVDFVRTVLLAWKHLRIVRPVEAGQGQPTIMGLLKSCAHVKLTSATT